MMALALALSAACHPAGDRGGLSSTQLPWISLSLTTARQVMALIR